MHILFSALLALVLCTDSMAEQLSPPASSKGSDVDVENISLKSIAAPRTTKTSVTFKSLAQMNGLIELGVPALALNLLEDEQKKRQKFTADWYTFEYKRILLLSALERWQVLIERTQWLFDTAKRDGHITRKIRMWFETQQVIARLQLKQSEQALSQLQVLLWTTKAENRDKSLPAIWRRQVVRAYLQMQLDDDARKSLVKYESDYATDVNDIDWVLLQAQVLLKTHRPRQAIDKLKQITDENAVDVEALLLIAQLQSQPGSAYEINQQMREKLDGKLLSRPARWAYSYVAYLASKVLGNQSAQILNLESVLSLGIRAPLLDESYHVSADDLWTLYVEQGKAIANGLGLLVGNEEQWQVASDGMIKEDPGKALALNAAQVLHKLDNSTSQQHKTIVEIIEKRNNGLELINQLYLHSSKVPVVAVLPDEVRYRLVDYALSEGDYFEAAKLMSSLEEPPQGNTLFDWRMRMARVLILQGEYERSENLIRKTFIEKPSISSAELDRYIQVVFDFQTVQQHQQAINLFNLLYLEGLNAKLKREIFFWKAESYFALKKYARAALFYLESARAVSEAENDLWAQSARFKAGQTLLLAEIYEDAETIFTDLLRVTVSDSRKALINQNLQKIRLLQSALTKE